MSASELRKELGKLCKGRGLMGPLDPGLVGPRLIERMTASGVSDSVDRGSVISWLTTAVEPLPEDLRLVAQVALGVHPEARKRFLGERLQWLAETLGRDERTVRRRVDEALVLLANVLSEEKAPISRSSARKNGWYFASIKTLVRLDLPLREVIEERRLVATAAALDTLEIEVSLPRSPGEVVRELSAEAMFGGLLIAVERPSDSLRRFVIKLPRTLRRGDRHSLTLRYTFPDPNLLRHYALTPLVRCDDFQLCLKCPPPEQIRVWRLDAVTPRMLDDSPAAGTEVMPDAANELSIEFSNPALGLAHGFRWRFLK
ncbi:hypothetical protein ABGB12_34250 [Actinocorallia sp. B10E7]|uniref:hypothetical protein n=1 Tax=Actinocorallia sp. B10E7 TaxID=3153558 RepID=UPI00325C5410